MRNMNIAVYKACRLKLKFIINSIMLMVCSLSAFSQPATIEQKIPGCNTPLKMQLIAGGSFTMGSPAAEAGRAADEGPQRMVSISPFYMSVFETAYEQYNAFFQDNNLSRNSDADAITRPSPPYLDFTLGMGKDGFPASSMQQYGAIMFCRWLYQQTGEFYRLPTEAEWEYAAHAGGTSTYISGNDATQLEAYAWFNINSQSKYQPVGKLKPNAWGLYDMGGNVAEWVLDQYDTAFLAGVSAGATDPFMQPTKRSSRLVKGGSYRDEAVELRIANRTPTDPLWNRRDPQVPKSKWWNTDAPFVGFRVVKPLKQPTAEEAENFFKRFLGK